MKFLTNTCNLATLEADLGIGVDSKPVVGSSPSRGGWIVWPPVIKHKERNLTKYWDLAET